MSKKRNLTEAEIAELDANHARREAIVRRAELLDVQRRRRRLSPAARRKRRRRKRSVS